MVINNGAKKESIGILTKERPRFCKDVEVWLPTMGSASSQLYSINLAGVKKSMVLFHKETTRFPDSSIVGVNCYEDGILTLKLMNPEQRTIDPVAIGLVIMAL